MAACCCCKDAWSGVSPLKTWAGSAPASSSSRVHATAPKKAATRSGDEPFAVGPTDAPAPRRSRAQSSWSYWHATASGVQPSSFATSIPAPASSSSPTHAARLFWQAT